MKKIFLLFLFLIYFVQPCFAVRWVEFFEKNYVDIDSLALDKYGNVTFWVKSLRKAATEKFDNKDFWYAKDYYVLNCSERKMSLNASTVYDLKENVIYSKDWEYNDWKIIIPDTYGEIYYEVFCKKNFDIINR